MQLICQKMKDAPEPAPLTFRSKAVPDLSLLRARNEVAAPVSGMVVVPTRDTARVRLSPEARVFKYINEHPGCRKGAVRTDVPGANDAKDRALRALLETGAVENRGTDNGHRYYVQPHWRVDPLGTVARIDEEFDVDAGPAREAS